MSRTVAFASGRGDRIVSLLGVTGPDVVSRVLGIILAALAAELLIGGIRLSLPG